MDLDNDMQARLFPQQLRRDSLHLLFLPPFSHPIHPNSPLVLPSPPLVHPSSPLHLSCHEAVPLNQLEGLGSAVSSSSAAQAPADMDFGVF